MSASWQRLNEEAPELATSVKQRFGANLHHILGTVRPSGAPRLSGTEVQVDDRSVSIGMMPDSRKLADVERDPRVEIHSAPLEEDLSHGDVKLRGHLIAVGDVADQPGAAFELDLDGVSRVRVVGDELELTTWSPTHGLRTLRRA